MLDELLLGKTRAAIPRELYLNVDRRFSFNELGRRTRAGDGALVRELKLLIEAGLVAEQQEGNQRFLTAEKSARLYPELKAFINKASRATQILREALSELESAVPIAFIFGSLAEGTERAESDVDLFIIGTAGYSVVTTKTHAVEARLGRPVQVLYFDPESPDDRRSLSGTSMNAILEGTKLFIFGDEDALVRLREAVRNSREECIESLLKHP